MKKISLGYLVHFHSDPSSLVGLKIPGGGVISVWATDRQARSAASFYEECAEKAETLRPAYRAWHDEQRKRSLFERIDSDEMGKFFASQSITDPQEIMGLSVYLNHQNVFWLVSPVAVADHGLLSTAVELAATRELLREHDPKGSPEDRKTYWAIHDKMRLAMKALINCVTGDSFDVRVIVYPKR